MKIKLQKLICKRCNHSWSPRKREVRQCPKCKSAYWDKKVVLVLCFLLLISTTAYANINLDKWADSIRKAEGNPNYGILSVKCKTEAECRQICKNTIYNTLVKYRDQRCKPGEDDVSCLARRYAPIGASNDPKGLNKNWEKNVRYFLDKEI